MTQEEGVFCLDFAKLNSVKEQAQSKHVRLPVGSLSASEQLLAVFCHKEVSVFFCWTPRWPVGYCPEQLKNTDELLPYTQQ